MRSTVPLVHVVLGSSLTVSAAAQLTSTLQISIISLHLNVTLVFRPIIRVSRASDGKYRLLCVHHDRYVQPRLSRQLASIAAACLFALGHNANAFFSPGIPAIRSSDQHVRFLRQQQQQPVYRAHWATRGGAKGPTNGVHHRASPKIPTAGEGRDRTRSARSDSDSGSRAVTMMGVDDSSQRGHFFGFGESNHKPSILQIITAQRYKGGVLPRETEKLSGVFWRRRERSPEEWRGAIKGRVQLVSDDRHIPRDIDIWLSRAFLTQMLPRRRRKSLRRS